MIGIIERYIDKLAARLGLSMASAMNAPQPMPSQLSPGVTDHLDGWLASQDASYDATCRRVELIEASLAAMSRDRERDR